MIAAELAAVLGHDLGFASVDDVTVAISATVPGYAGATPQAIDAEPSGVLSVVKVGAVQQSIALEHAPSNYDYRLVVSRKLYDRAVGTALSPSLAKLGMGAGAHVHPADLDRIGEPDGAEVKLISASGSVVLPLVADDSVQQRGVDLGALQPIRRRHHRHRRQLGRGDRCPNRAVDVIRSMRSPAAQAAARPTAIGGCAS